MSERVCTQEGSPQQVQSKRGQMARRQGLFSTAAEASAPQSARLGVEAGGTDTWMCTPQGALIASDATRLFSHYAEPQVQRAAEPAAQTSRLARGQTRHQLRIVANPHVAIAVPGTTVHYTITQDAEVHPEGAYYTYQWLCVNDLKTSRTLGIPEVVQGPRNTPTWHATWGFPGNHKVLCLVQFHRKQFGFLSGHSDESPEFVEYQQAVQAEEDVLRRAFSQASQPVSPEAQLQFLEAYQQTLKTAEQQPGSEKVASDVVARMDSQLTSLRDKLHCSDGQIRYPLQAAHVTAENGQVSSLHVFVSRIHVHDGQETWVLVDITNPTDRRLTGEYVGHGKDAQQAIQSAIFSWERGNRYPKGRLLFQVPIETGVRIEQSFQTDGMSFWDSVAEFFTQVGFYTGIGMAGAAALLTIAPEPVVSKAAAVLLWTSILAATTGASINILQRRAAGMAVGSEDAMDVLTIVGNLLGARWAIGAKVAGLGLTGSRMGTAVVVGRISTDAAQGILLSAEYVKEYQQILLDSNPKQRTDRLVMLISQATLSGGLLLLSMRSNKADLEHLGIPKTSLGRLGQHEETIHLSRPQCDSDGASSVQDAQHASLQIESSAGNRAETPQGARPYESAQRDLKPSSVRAPNPRVLDPVPGLYDSVDTALHTAPPGWAFQDEITDSPGQRRILTIVVGPVGKEGKIQRIYDLRKKQLIMDFAFLDELPNKIHAGVPLRPGEGTPTVTYLTLRQMKMAGGQFANLESIRMRHIQNIESLMQLKQLTHQGLSMEDAIRKTHSVKYAETSIQQSGHTIVEIRVDTAESFQGTIGWLMSYYETAGNRHPPDPARVQKHEALLLKYNMTRSDVVLANYDIELALAIHPNILK